MSKIDLDRLVVRQTYFLPIAEPSQIKTVILNKLISTEPKLLQRIVPWQISREQECSCDFTFMFMYEYILEETIGIDSTESKKFKSLANKKMKEYTRKMPESYFKTLSSIRSGTPIEIHLIITKKEENGCLCKIECLPALYRKLVQLDNMEVSDFEIRDSYLSCKRFIESIFEGGLSATLVTEEKKEISKPTIEFLINDEASHQIMERIETMLEGATGEILIVGWVGTILLPKLMERKEKGVKIRVITHKAKELKGRPERRNIERAYQELIQMIGLDNVSIKPEFHGRALIVDNKALIGSMDLNSYSLGGTHREFGVYTGDPEIVLKLRNYFNRIFSPLKKEEVT